jgi:CubicO group peptidase (beta-lactamase class C family)
MYNNNKGFRSVFLMAALSFPVTAAAQPAAVAPAVDTPPATSPSAIAPSTHVLNAADLEAWLDGYFPNALNAGDIAGGVVAVVKDGQVLFEKGYGFADFDKRTPVDAKTTLFRWGSVSKLFTWTAVMQLVEQGRIDLDGDVNQYLDFKIPARDGKPVSMRNIMTHTAGFEERLKGITWDAADGDLPLDKYLKEYVPVRIY